MLQKQPININFSKGLDLKTDPNQIPIGNFLRLQNSVFDKGGRLTKRNGFGPLTTLPSTVAFLTTFNNNLTAVGNSILAFADGPNTWVNRGTFYPISVNVLSLIRANTQQTQVDAVTSPNNLVCTVYTDTGSGSTIYKYAVADSITGQNIIAPTAIPNTGTVTNAPRVFLLANYFIIVFGTVISATNHLQYVAINITSPTAPSTATDISSQFTPSTTLAFDGYVSNNNLFLAWNGSDGGGAIRMTSLSSTLVLHTTKIFTGRTATLMSVYADMSSGTPKVWATFWSANDGYTLQVDQNFNTILAPTKIINGIAITNLTSASINGTLTAFYETHATYSYDAGISTNLINKVTCTSAGVVGSPAVVARSLGIASKAFVYNNDSYLLGIYQSDFQPTNFLINSTGQVVAKLAYSNAGQYLTTGLPSAVIVGTKVSIGYRFKDLIQAVNKTQGVTNTAGVYSQTGLNLATYDFDSTSFTSEIGSTLNLTGGFPWMYDGYSPVELGFHLWPDSVEVTTATGSGNITAQQYFYQALYEWTDNQGNIHRSAPSIPAGIVTTTASSTNTINVPTLRLTYKTANPVKIVIYRWSTAQQNYYQVTSITSPLFNDITTDSVVFTDTQADSAILGNSLIYTTGGVIENIAGPACSSMTLFDSRMWLIDAEDRNLLWYSKPIIETTPVEMSDLFTVYIAPNISAQGSTGDTQCIAPMDDKLIVFKKDAMYYINGSGPDITGANSQYSQPIFITSTVGCSNQNSIVLMQDGLMFQSDKGIWLLGRGLNSVYIGAAVEDFTKTALVESAVNVPGTTQIRFTLDSGVTLMYDYFFQQWGTFTNIPAVSSTLYQGLHTYLDTHNNVFQETAGKYLDGSNPVLQAFSTGWINPGGLQGFQRAYWVYILGTYLSPHKLNVQIAYDYSLSPSQSTTVTPVNTFSTWGSDASWGSGESWGNGISLEEEQVYFQKQKCNAFQIIVDEMFDPSFGTVAGAGLTMSGISLTVGIKKTYPTLAPTKRFG